MDLTTNFSSPANVAFVPVILPQAKPNPADTVDSILARLRDTRRDTADDAMLLAEGLEIIRRQEGGRR